MKGKNSLTLTEIINSLFKKKERSDKSYSLLKNKK